MVRLFFSPLSFSWPDHSSINLGTLTTIISFARCVAAGLGYHLFDQRYLGGVLRASERDRVKIERTESASDRTVGLRSPIRKVTWFGMFVAAAVIVVAYVVYIVYALGT